MDIAAHLTWLDDFVSQKIASADRDPEPLQLKLFHTRQVLANILEIGEKEKFDRDLLRASAWTAIYHDLARFDQYLEYGTFKDSQSRNHGAWAVQLVKRYNRLAGETKEIQSIVLTAINLHNRLELPRGITGKSLAAARAIRDADKLDILRVMDEHLGKPGPYNPTVVLSLPDSPHLYSQKTIEDALAHRAASYSDLRSVNDLRLLLGTWLFSMNFPSSRQMFASRGHIQSLLAGLPVGGVYDKAASAIRECLG